MVKQLHERALKCHTQKMTFERNESYSTHPSDLPPPTHSHTTKLCVWSTTKKKKQKKKSHHLTTGVALRQALAMLVEHGGVQREAPAGPVLAGEHHHGRLHLGYWLQALPLHMGRGHGVPVGV